MMSPPTPLKSTLRYVQGNSLVPLTKLLTKSLVALFEIVTIAQSPKHTTPPSPTRRPRFPTTLDHSSREIFTPMARRWKGIVHIIVPG